MCAEVSKILHWETLISSLANTVRSRHVSILRNASSPRVPADDNALPVMSMRERGGRTLDVIYP